MPDVPIYEIPDEVYDDFDGYAAGTYTPWSGGFWPDFTTYALAVSEVEIYGTLNYTNYQKQKHGINHYI